MNTSQTSYQVYPRQFFLLAFISAVCFKVVMLPQYLSVGAGRMAYLTMAWMMLIELGMLGIVYGFVSRASLFGSNLPDWLKAVLALAILASSLFKGSILCCESLHYICTALFDNATWSYAMLALLPCLFYLSYKGGNILARTSEILFWFLAAAFLFNVMFAHAEGSLSNLSPFQPDASVWTTADRHLIWFGDFTPLLFLQVVPTKKKSRVYGILTVLATLICPVMLMLAFQTIYGGGGVLVSNAFSKLSIFNKISFLLGTVDFPTVCAWLMMATIKLSLILYGAAQCLHYFVRKHAVVSSILVTLAMGAIVLIALGSIGNAYRVATTWIRYLFGLLEYAVPMIAYTALRICNRKSDARLPIALNDAPRPKALPERSGSAAPQGESL